MSFTLITMLASCKYKNPELQHNVSVLFINVGKGDSILVQADDKSFLIDTGTKASALSIYKALAVRNVKKLDGLILTHAHVDHIGGFEGVVKKYPVDCLYSSSVYPMENAIDRLEWNSKRTKVSLGDKINITDDIFFEVLAPSEYNESDENNNSLVLRLRAFGKTFLFAGDMCFDEEDTLLESGCDLKADVFKVPHHGNEDTTSELLISKVAPEISVVSKDTGGKGISDYILKNLCYSDVYLTENFECGVLIKYNKKGNLLVSDPKIPKIKSKLSITKVDKENQTLYISNKGGRHDLSGYFIISAGGDKLFVFPEGSYVGKKKTISVACKGGTGDYIWNEENIWTTEGKDKARLYDKYGNLLLE